MISVTVDGLQSLHYFGKGLLIKYQLKLILILGLILVNHCDLEFCTYLLNVLDDDIDELYAKMRDEWMADKYI